MVSKGAASTSGAPAASLRRIGFMEITGYHAKLYALELTRRCASDEVERLAPVLAHAQVDLLDHGFRDKDQIKVNDAKLFASTSGENFNKFKAVQCASSVPATCQ